jgi:tetratricopeptide (TPR) repeat protein
MKEQQNSIFPPIDSILADLAIAPTTIKFIKPRSKRSQYRAILNWIEQYKSQPNASNLDKIKGLLQSFYHFAQIEDWDRANKIICIHLNTPGRRSRSNELYSQLLTWNYYQELITLFQILLGKLNLKTDMICYRGLGSAYAASDRYQQSLYYSQKSLETAREINDLEGIGLALCNLGSLYGLQGNLNLAFQYHSQSFEIVQKLESSRPKALILGNFGTISGQKRKDRQAIEYLEQSFRIAQEIGDFDIQEKAMTNLGNIYGLKRDLDKSLECYQKSLEISREICDRDFESTILDNIGKIYNFQKDYEKSIEYHKKSLNLARNQKNRSQERATLSNLGITYGEKKDYSIALDCFQKSLNIAQQLETYPDIFWETANICIVYFLSHQYAQLIRSLFALLACTYSIMRWKMFQS